MKREEKNKRKCSQCGGSGKVWENLNSKISVRVEPIRPILDGQKICPTCNGEGYI